MPNFSACLFRTSAGTLLAVFLLAVRLQAVAQAPAWQSAQAVAMATAASTSVSEVKATAPDAAGNVFLTGSFTNTVVLGTTILTSLGNRDVFVAKFNPSSNQFVWAQRAGGSGNDQAVALAVSGTSVYVAGSFASPTASFGSTTLSNALSGITDAFVAKLTDAGSAGNFVWAQRVGGTNIDAATALAVSGTSVYITGYFASSTATFGATTLTNAGAVGAYDVFVAKLTDMGSASNFVWAQQAGGLDWDVALALAVNGTSVYVAGFFQSATAAFGSTTLSNAVTNYRNDVFVAKLTDAGSTGSFVWAQRAGGADADEATALAVSGTSVYITGYFASSTVGFGAATLTNAGPANSTDAFVAKLTDAGSAGNFVWAQQTSGTDDEMPTALAVSGSSLYVAGYFYSSTAGFGATTLTNAGPANSTDVFVAKLTDAGSTGNFAWAQRAGGTGNDQANALAVSGSVYVAGSFVSPTASFGPTALSNPNAGALLGFLATINDATLTPMDTGRNLPDAQLFPNPAHHMVTLRLPAGATPTLMVLTDALGRTVRCYPAPASLEYVLDLRGLPTGLYLLRGAGPAQRLMVE
jgi:hypothetical protein